MRRFLWIWNTVTAGIKESITAERMKRDMAKVSVIVTVYNVEKYLNKCVDSLLAQTLSDIEILLVDDGSTDGSGRICDDYAGKDSRVRVIHKENGGVSSARNKGLFEASAEYVGFVDSDDYVAEDMYECLYSNLKKEDADVSVRETKRRCSYYDPSFVKNPESCYLNGA